MIAAHAAGIRVFATGGIGGVHRGALGVPGSSLAPTFDVSSDLAELARTPMAIVCAGPKAILDVPATLEYLETHGVPVVAVGQTDLPGFTARSGPYSGARSAPMTARSAAARSFKLVSHPVATLNTSSCTSERSASTLARATSST